MSKPRIQQKISAAPAKSQGSAPPRLTPEAVRFLNLYTALTSARNGARRRTPIEKGNEEKTQLRAFDRMEAVAIGRDLNRNNPKAITIIEQRKVLTLGRVRAQFNTENEAWNEAADTAFNRYFSRDCFYEYPAHLADIAQLVEGAKMREGDILVAYDDFLLNTGKLMIWEADQLVSVNESDWKDPQKNSVYRYDKIIGDTVISTPFFQDQGVICNQFKKVVGYIVSSLNLADEKRASMTLPIDDVLIIPADCARLVSHRFRTGQRRGVPSLLPVAGNLADIDEMIKSELSTAKMRSKIMAWVKHKAESGLPPDQAKLVADALRNMDQSGADGAATGDGTGEDCSVGAASCQVVERPLYRKIEEATGGMTEYLDDDDDIVIPNIDRPNIDTATFHDALGDVAGASQGLGKAFTRMAATSSYTAHRGETCMTNRHIVNHQKKHEHDWLDWLAVKVINRAIAKKELVTGPNDWEYLISWEMPRPDAIDPEKEARADQLNLKNGKYTLRDVIGPNWRKRLREYATQLDEAKKNGIPLSVFETVAGAVANVITPKTKENGGDEE